MTGKRLLYAPNIHQGGGRALLIPLLENLQKADDVAFVLDVRMKLPSDLQLTGKIYRVKATLFSRLCFEWQLRRIVSSGMLLLCMGNLPLLFAHKGIQQVFIQNRYLVDDVALDSFRWPVRLRLMVERWWLRSRASYVNKFIVQTSTMQSLVKKTLDSDADVFPFTAEMTDMRLQCVDNEATYDFLYVASGEPHKNHKILVDAWVKLSEKGCFPSLCLTLDAERFPDLCVHILEVRKIYKLNITMIGECEHKEIQRLYSVSSAMIYPSLFESFGLPLIEAVMAGLPILASNASYVDDVIQASAVFDPLSAQSIADSVQMFCGNSAILNIELLDASEFIAQTFSQGADD